ncbi:hypothetical protein KSC_102590 [Ktedonobacter sp. SOSP1-52]|uniref:FAD-dependent oxidoreductase n=1 Tax=Ktedonobacter sp. SOSP1-52 TaxID=2778366 RepID=UPI001914FD0D|nr:NAD(P)/FAD-dependent oxidoreductase [Ktedonobacter sp. SOSP1-52]GHO71367.1 hypothetical protein KSC_102590 [Ktedonobacter sp. SOSP1-52]
MNNNIKQGKKALIIGGGIAGLLTARVLSEQYDDILVVERDGRPEKPEARAGAPQSFHLHQVLPRGEMILERFFPGFSNDLLELGAFPIQKPVRWINRYGTMMMPAQGVFYSRALLEWVMRQRVQALPNVRFLYHQEVTDLETSPDRTRITGVHIRQRGQLEQQETLIADLIVVAGGRSSKLPQWLTALGYEQPEDEHLISAIGYSTRYYKVPEEKKGHAPLIVIENDHTKGNSAGGVLKSIEGDAWAVCLSSIAGQYPPTSADGFDEGLTRLINPVIAEVLRDAEPLTEPRGFRIPECIRHHYEQVENWPAGLLVLGDAFCYFDPVYGQGMTVAAIEAEALADCLSEQQGTPQAGFEHLALQRMQEAIYPAWWLSALEDLRWSGVIHSGQEPLKHVEFLHKYFDLSLKRLTQQFEKQQQTGEFNPLFMNYMMMTALIVSPRDVVNVNMLNALLDEVPEERDAILADLFQGYDQPNIEAVLDEVVPAFSLHYDEQTVSSQEEEVLQS